MNEPADIIARAFALGVSHRRPVPVVSQSTIDALDAAGFAIVPKKPTEAMLEAADDAAARIAMASTVTHHDTGLAVWPAMISAALREGEK